MYKPDRLRKLLSKRIPYFKQNPDALQLFYANGYIHSTGATSLSWQYHYDLEIIIEDFPDSPDLIFLAVQEFIKVEQAELVLNPNKQQDVKFEADPNNNETYDLSITIPLSERVIVSVENNAYQIKHAEEPQPTEWQEIERIQIYVRNEQDKNKYDKQFDSNDKQ
ncbi:MULTISPECIES: phage tail protein [Pasteurellaceae]|uniref:Phage tail protein n=1 Tax=Pasteurella atlantica TaxID=2827233 RepID=A0AAW8CSY5_9PAST|nr:phage tail protein [Pasteurella atlantica]MBR0573347.1 phage tail protein [Pasteurella atlantica]MDP8040471.1 phage tail protein [Pasteurella atlantica]MDP8041862.1 phage tail protein [Pasteurella atlantica]MDP8043929.1 phage tail protein [Pasteurella atlantica]MDP8046792.1 phage tail protein [Pasteurella atlantica]